MFLVSHGISRKRLDTISKSNGLAARVHGNTQRKPKHALSFSSTEYVVRFLLMYSEEHSLLLPGTIPGYKRDDIQLLPSSTTKRAVWRVYCSAAEVVSMVHVVAYSTFYLWRTLVPSSWSRDQIFVGNVSKTAFRSSVPRILQRQRNPLLLAMHLNIFG